ncbi:hypothetical protein [Methylorubrum populi]|uniref:hypothetical protein n=1 Tax=Methylorubrum populi TaxID=223967 RepID=UPI003F65B593
MAEIDLPSVKELLWHKMRGDLTTLVPWFASNDLLLCPTCGRALKYDEFSVEHIIPQQAVADDPAAVRVAISKNMRSGLTLLCKRTLVFSNKSIPGHGCNSWKGKYYDKYIREALQPDVLSRRFHSRHHMAVMAAGYLGLFREYGYQIALLPSGLLMRSQFFRPNSFVPEMPMEFQMLLTGGPPESYTEDDREYWSEPFKVGVEAGAAYVVMRHFSLRLPLSRDPTVPLARALPYAPPRYRLRLNLAAILD